jgi:2-C-methyl-D-erythritol 2,4-cyclodiphosphate synthase
MPTPPRAAPASSHLPFRIGHGYDLHRLEPRPPSGNGRLLILGGESFPGHPTGPVSHSDGDAVYHAVTDAILGALALPDIGQFFPDNDPRHESADSSIFVRQAAGQMSALQYILLNLDITVICETPKLGPHKNKIIQNIASLLDCDPMQINIKGKTHEKVDAIGEGRALEVHAVVLLASLGRSGPSGGSGEPGKMQKL